MRIRIYLTIIAFITILFACNNSDKRTSGEIETNIRQPVIVFDSVARFYTNGPGCKSDFYYYIPGAGKNRSCPVIYLFDPHGMGNETVRRYRSLSDSLQVILVGSNQLKNGLQPDVIQSFVSCLVSSVQLYLPVDTAQTVFAGFSGGGRIALEFGPAFGTVKGIISCGAAHIPSRVNDGLTYAFIAGDEDFNYLECRETLLRFPARKHLFFQSFSGIHEWPPAGKMGKAISECIHQEQTSGDFSYAAEEKKVFDEEIKQRSLIQQSMGTKDIEWWQNYVENLKDEMNQKNVSRALSAKRLMNYISMFCYAYTERALDTKNLQLIQYCLVVYHLADPENPDMHFFNACYNSMIQNKEHAMDELEKAVDLGFSDLEKIENSAVPEVLYDDPRYAVLVGKLMQGK